MRPNPEGPSLCPRTEIQYRWSVPGDLPRDLPAPYAVFFLNGIGLDLDGFQEAIQTVGTTHANYPYQHGYHLALTVPGFEDGEGRVVGQPLSMIEQAGRVATFMESFLDEHPAKEVILYGFSFGSDLAVEVLACLGARLTIARVVLTEINVHPHSCFITSRITAAYKAARGHGPNRNREAYQGFVSRVVKACAEGRLSASLMQDMALYFRTIARKDWAQLAKSAEDASDNPEARIARLLGITGDSPGSQFDLVFSDPQDLRIFQRRMETWGGPLGKIRVFDSTAHEHFHHMSLAGIQENLGGLLREVVRNPSRPN